MRVVGRFPIVREMVKWVGACLRYWSWVREDPVSLLWDILGEVVSTSRLHRKSDSVVEAGRPATEGDWISRVTIGERQRKHRGRQRHRCA